MDASGKLHNFLALASENYTPLPVRQDASCDTKSLWTFGEQICILNLPGIQPWFLRRPGCSLIPLTITPFRPLNYEQKHTQFNCFQQSKFYLF